MKSLQRTVVALALVPSLCAAEVDVFDAEHVDTQPTTVTWVAPDYPGDLRHDGMEGIAVVEYVVDTDGRVTAARCIGANDPRFGTALVDAITRCRFEPGMIKAQPVKTRCVREWEFNLVKPDRKALRISPPKEFPKSTLLPTELVFVTRANSPLQFVGSRTVVYPFEALQLKKAGHAKIQFSIGPDSRAHSLKVLASTAPEFALAAQARLSGVWFSPDKYQKDGDNWPYVVDFDFKPDGSGDVEVNDSARSLLKLMRTHPEEIYTSGFDSPPRALRTSSPYPPPNLPKDGQAVIEVLIDKSGHAQLPRVVSCTEPEFGAATAQAAILWLFVPAQRSGKPVVARARIPFAFDFSHQPANQEPNRPIQPARADSPGG